MFLTMKYSNDDSGRFRQDSASSASSGGRLKSLFHRSKQEHRKSAPSTQSPGMMTAALHLHEQQQQQVQHQQATIRTSDDSLNVSSGALIRAKHLTVPNEFDDDALITASPGGTPPKKIWEGAYSKFLRGNGKSNNKSTSPTLSSSLESTASLPKETMKASSKAEVSGGKKSAFAIIPGTKRLVSRAPLSPGSKHGKSRLIQVDDAKVPPFPSLKVSPRTTASLRKQDGGLDEHLHGGVRTAVPPSPGKESSIRGGGLFRSVFSNSSNGNIPRSTSLVGKDDLDQRHRRYQSMDALDVPLRKGVEKSSSVSLSPVQLMARNEAPVHASLAVDALRSNEEIEYEESSNLDDLLASAESTPSSQHYVISLPGVSQRAYSMSGIAQSRTAEGIGLSPAMLSKPTSGYLHPRSFSQGYRPDAQYEQNQALPNVPNSTAVPPLVPPLPSAFKWSTSDTSQNIGMTLDDSDRSVSDDYIRRSPISSGEKERAQEILGNACDILDKPGLFVTTAGYSPSSPPRLFQPTEDIKKVFTNFHNAPKYARDSSSAYLGGTNSSNVNLAAAHDSFVSYHSSLMRAGGNLASSGDFMSERDLMRPSHHLETVEELNISINKGMRLLKPIQGTEAWQSGRRYLIAPAAMSACPLPSINKLSGSLIQTASEAVASGPLRAFGTIDFGEALTTYVGEKHHLSLGKWSACRLVLRQNYLFEYEPSTAIKGLPRGYVHLQYAVAYAHADFQDVLELQFYASPCAKSDHRTLRIQVQNRQDRDHCISCLNNAANLRMEDIWDVSKDRPFGTGRYATVFPATRRSIPGLKDDSSLRRNQCALKVVDKNQFWRRVVKGQERSDTLVRELAVQATLTARSGSSTLSFSQLRGFFETSDHVVLELELLGGKDLFEYIQSKGTLSEGEAAIIIRDVLTTLDGMNRNGLAHRDIKPANILMADPSVHGVSVKLCDFGMSTFVGVDGLVRGRCGTPGYVAPEILTAGTRAGYGNKVDVFSAGVTLYLMLSGVEPFYGETEEELVEDNTRAKVDFPKKYWSSISSDAKDLVQRMLRADPGDRLSAKEALQHPWLASKIDNKTSKCGREIEGPFAGVPPEEGVCSIM